MDTLGYDFKGAKFDISLVKGKVIDAFPSLKHLTAFEKDIKAVGLDFDKILVYCLCLYQSNTPLFENDDLRKRKFESAKIATFDMDKGKFSEVYLKVINGEIDCVQRVMIAICKLQRSTDFSTLMIFEDLYYQELLKSLTDDKATDTKTRIQNIKSLKGDLDDIKSTILNKDTSSASDEALMDQIEFDRLELSPELIAVRERDELIPIEGYDPYEIHVVKTKKKKNA